jgi:hypothetical protein
MWRTKRTSRPIIGDPSFGDLESVWDVTLALRFPLRLSRLLSSCCIVLTAQSSCTICFNEIIRKNLCDQIFPQILCPDHSHVTLIF